MNNFLSKIALIFIVINSISSSAQNFVYNYIEPNEENSYVAAYGDTAFYEAPKSYPRIKVKYGLGLISNFKEGYLPCHSLVEVSRTAKRIKLAPLYPIPQEKFGDKSVYVSSIEMEDKKYITFECAFDEYDDFLNGKPRKGSTNNSSWLFYNWEEISKEVNTFLADRENEERNTAFNVSKNDIPLKVIVNRIDKRKIEEYSVVVVSMTIKLLDPYLKEHFSILLDVMSDVKVNINESEGVQDAIKKGLCMFLSSDEVVRILNSNELSESFKVKTYSPLKIKEGNVSGGYRNMSDAVVTIQTSNGHGSGCQISKDGLIVTNFHVVGNNDSVQVVFSGGDSVVGIVDRVNPFSDLALIRVPRELTTTFRISSEEVPKIGTEVFAIGTPLDVLLPQSMSRGIISSKVNIYGREYIHTDAKINFGNSGGALLDKEGNLIGIVNAKIVGINIQGIGFAIPVKYMFEDLNIQISE